VIEIKKLSFTYPDGTRALSEVSIEFPPEHIFAIMGASGSGKTTLLNCVARFLEPQRGTIFFRGEDISGIPEKVFRERLGVVFQQLNLFPHMNVMENLMLAPMRVQKRSEKDAESAAMEMLERLNIAELQSSYPAQMSGGQAQRAAIARGLMLRPEVMLLDEPTSALDAETTSDFAQWLKELQSDTSFIIVTHDLPFARDTAEQGVFMRDGCVIESGKISDIIQQLS
jgi:polar amino acid transport system ATP-binding protein